MKTVNISISEDLLSRTDAYAKKKGLNRSVLITMALNTYLDAMDELPTVQAQLNDLKVAFDEFVKNN